MKTIAVIERRDQPDVVERILRHCNLWDRPASRAPPPRREPQQLDLELHSTSTPTNSSWHSDFKFRGARGNSPPITRFGLHLSPNARMCPQWCRIGPAPLRASRTTILTPFLASKSARP